MSGGGGGGGGGTGDKGRGKKRIVWGVRGKENRGEAGEEEETNWAGASKGEEAN